MRETRKGLCGNVIKFIITLLNIDIVPNFHLDIYQTEIHATNVGISHDISGK